MHIDQFVSISLLGGRPAETSFALCLFTFFTFLICCCHWVCYSCWCCCLYNNFILLQFSILQVASSTALFIRLVRHVLEIHLAHSCAPSANISSLISCGESCPRLPPLPLPVQFSPFHSIPTAQLMWSNGFIWNDNCRLMHRGLGLNLASTSAIFLLLFFNFLWFYPDPKMGNAPQFDADSFDILIVASVGNFDGHCSMTFNVTICASFNGLNLRYGYIFQNK